MGSTTFSSHGRPSSSPPCCTRTHSQSFCGISRRPLRWQQPSTGISSSHLLPVQGSNCLCGHVLFRNLHSREERGKREECKFQNKTNRTFDLQPCSGEHSHNLQVGRTTSTLALYFSVASLEVCFLGCTQCVPMCTMRRTVHRDSPK